MEINNKMTSEQIFKNLKLKEHTIYRVIVKSTKENIDHYAFLFVGFKSGSYCLVYSNNYDQPIPMQKMYSIVIDKKLSKIKSFKFKTKKEKVMKKYFTIEARDSSNLDKKVNEQLDKGAKLVGGASVSRGEGMKDIYLQAMTEQ